MNNSMEVNNLNVTTEAMETYVKPVIEVIEMELEGVIAGSGGNGLAADFDDGGSIFN